MSSPFHQGSRFHRIVENMIFSLKNNDLKPMSACASDVEKVTGQQLDRQKATVLSTTCTQPIHSL
jgi:hypothetical protein